MVFRTCPFMSRDGKLIPCQATCAMNNNGVCAFARKDSTSELSAQMEQAQRLALLKQLVSRSR